MDPEQPSKPRGRARGRGRIRERSRSPVRPGPPPAQNPPPQFQVPLNLGREIIEPPRMVPQRQIQNSLPVQKFEGNKKGTKGNAIQLQANYFKMCSVPQFNIFQFSVHFEPDEERIHVRRALLASKKAELGTGYLFDGSILFTSSKTPRNPMILDVTDLHSGTQRKITIKYVKQVQFGDFQYTQVLNIIVRKVMAMLDLQLVGRNFYDPAAMTEVREFGLQLWPGYITAVRQHESDLLLSARITTKVMRVETALGVIRDLLRTSAPGDFRQRVSDAILGMVVVTAYNNRTYRVDDIDFGTTPNSTFSTKNGSTISFVEYYKQRYEIEIKDPEQPMLVSKSKAREMRAGAAEVIYLVPELCRMTGLSDEMRNNFQLMKAIADRTRTNPQQRVNNLLKFAQRMLQKQTVVDELNSWKMKISPNLVSFQGRVLPREIIVQGANGNLKFDSGHQVDWTNNIKSNEALSAGVMDFWVAIVPKSFKQQAMEFLKEILMTGRAMGIKINDPYLEEIENDSQGVYVNAIDSILSRRVPDILLCFVSNSRGDRYSAIKKRCSIERNVVSQVVTGRILSNRSRKSIATKIVQQMNCKVGGASWTTSNPSALKDLMAVGFDLSKDSINKNVAFGALVASMDDNFTQYFSQVIECKKGEDLSRGICNGLCNALRRFKEKKGQLPSRIVFYRDGIDEFSSSVCTLEADKIKEMLLSVYKSDDFRLAYVLVSRRCNTRLFTSNGNPPAGTVVDDCITLPERYDFFLISQSVRQGSVNPTSYQVVSDNTGFTACQMQRLTYKLTHLYCNWSGTVSVPAPAQYARKLSVLVSQALHKTPNQQLNDLLHFL